MIEVTNLTKYYADRCAVKGLSFSVKKGQLVAQSTPEELQATNRAAPKPPSRSSATSLPLATSSV